MFKNANKTEHISTPTKKLYDGACTIAVLFLWLFCGLKDLKDPFSPGPDCSDTGDTNIHYIHSSRSSSVVVTPAS